MRKFRQKLCLLALFVLAAGNFMSNACTIFIANDGQHVWIGNNEDEVFTKKYRFWYYPAHKASLGYMIWTELTISPLFYGLMYKNPQGGLNEYGLFMDYTAIDESPVSHDPGKKDRKKELVHDLLKTCKTVEEALAYIGRFNLVKLNEAQLFIADASGDYATVHGGYIVRRTTPNFALTNYCIKNGHREACYRRDVATKYLNLPDQQFQLATIKNILEKSAQKPPQTITTNFSMAIDLKSCTIHLFIKNDFNTEKTLDLKAELLNGKRHKDLASYFPADPSPLLEKIYGVKGIDKTIEAYKELRNNPNSGYNFADHSVENLAIRWIDNNHVKDAILLLKTIQEYESANTAIYTWLGVAYRKDNNLAESTAYFSKVLEQNPNDYLATLWGKQENQRVIFKLNDFEGAEEVQLMGEFTQWKQNAIKMTKQNGFWTCEAILPKGENLYKFRVNQENLTDKINRMFVGSGPDMYSKIYVW